MNLTITPLNTKSVIPNRQMSFKAKTPTLGLSSEIYIGNNSFIGLMGEHWYAGNIFKKSLTSSLKSNGIKNVVDMMGIVKPKNLNGIEYFGIDIDSHSWGFLRHPPFGYRGYTPSGHLLNESEYTKLSKIYVQKFVRLIQMLQEGNTFLRSYFDRDARYLLIMNKFFNPQASKIALKEAPAYAGNERMVEKYLRLYYQLSAEDKAAMHWTPEFDKNVIPRLDKNLKKFVETHHISEL